MTLSEDFKTHAPRFVNLPSNPQLQLLLSNIMITCLTGNGFDKAREEYTKFKEDNPEIYKDWQREIQENKL